MNFKFSFVQTILIVLSLWPFVMCSQSAHAQSMFERRSPNQIDQYTNFSAKRRGDLLTIFINESTDVENRDERAMDKTGSSDLDASFGYGLTGGLGTAAGTATYDQATSGSRNFSGDTELRIARQFADRFTVVVVDVLPNGNLLVAGERNIFVQGDSRTLKLSGIVRQLDLLATNSVPSQLVANMKIELKGKGPEQSFSNQGWLGKRLNRIWPF